MSGYLHRLIDSAAGRADSVRPLTGSVFARHREEIAAPAQSVEEHDAVIASHPRASAAAPPQLNAPDDAAAPNVRQNSTHIPLLPAIVAPETHPSESATPSARLEPRTVEEFAASVDEPTGGPRRRLAGQIPEALATVTAGATRAADGRPASRIVPESIFDPGSRARAGQHPPQTKPAARVDREDDDIQIHIGRIEVTAVTPPAPRVPKPPDQALSLDAYLNRRSGRAR